MPPRLLERLVADGHRYEVRRDGGAVSLYRDGVLHTRHDEAAPVSGRVWDLLTLPAFVAPPARALVLGVGGGAVIRQLLRFATPRHVDGVDLDATHLRLAVRHFGLEDPRVSLHHQDARAHVERATAQYDYVLEDVFGGSDDAPHRAIPLDAAWAEALLARLRPGGVLVVNHANEREVRQSVLGDPAFLARFATTLALTTSTASNVVIACFASPTSPHALRAAARAALGDHAAALDVRVHTRR